MIKEGVVSKVWYGYHSLSEIFKWKLGCFYSVLGQLGYHSYFILSFNCQFVTDKWDEHIFLFYMTHHALSRYLAPLTFSVMVSYL